MSRSSTTMNTMLFLTCVTLFAVCLSTYQQVNGNPMSKSNRDEPTDDDLIVFPTATECREDEVAAPGKLPECEPTCRDPKPVCRKIFHIMDHVPCFCKSPRVRHHKRCIPLDECP